MSEADVQIRITTRHPQVFLNEDEYPSSLDHRELFTEYWKPVAANPAYSVSSFGRVRNERSGRQLKGSVAGLYGMYQVRLHYDGRSLDFQIHRLVAEAFDPYFDGYYKYRHINGDTSNNSIANIERCPQGASQRRGGRTGH